MNSPGESRAVLARHIAERRAEIRAWIAGAAPRSRRLTNLSIVGSAVAGLLTVGPAAGGPSLTAAITKALELEAVDLQRAAELYSQASAEVSFIRGQTN
jgi:hypothetical protein